MCIFGAANAGLDFKLFSLSAGISSAETIYVISREGKDFVSVPIPSWNTNLCLMNTAMTQTGEYAAICGSREFNAAQGGLHYDCRVFRRNNGEYKSITLTTIDTFPNPSGNAFMRLAMHPTKNILVVGFNAGNRLRVYDLSETGVTLRRAISGQVSPITRLSFSPDGRFLLVSGGSTGNSNPFKLIEFDDNGDYVQMTTPAAIQPLSLSNSPMIMFSASGNFAVLTHGVVSAGTAPFRLLRVDQMTGSFTEVSHNIVATSTRRNFIHFSPDDGFALRGETSNTQNGDSNGSPSFYKVKDMGSAVEFTEIPGATAVLPQNMLVTSVRFSAGGKYMGVVPAYSADTCVQFYKISGNTLAPSVSVPNQMGTQKIGSVRDISNLV